MKFKLHILVLLCSFAMSTYLFGQATSHTLTITNQTILNDPTNQRAAEAIVVKPQSSIQATSPNMSRLYIDKTLTAPVSYNLSGVNYSNTIPQIDYALPVGTIAGSGNVTPSGQGAYNIPISVPPGTKGMVPSLSISYNSGSTEGIAGRGWNIGGISVITRVPKDIYHDCEKKGVQLTSSDVYALDGIRITGSNLATTGAGLENYNFSKITNPNTGVLNNFFKVETKEGLIMEYGNISVSSNSQLLVSNPTTPSVQLPLAWYLSKVYDRYGNYMLYDYYNQNGEVALKEIKYTGNLTAGIDPYNSIKFYYDVRTDQFTRYLLNNPLSSKLILREIEVNCENKFVKRYQFKYGLSSGQSFLNEIQEQGSDFSKLNSTFIKYGDNITSTNAASISIPQTSQGVLTANADYRAGDFNGDGKSDLVAFLYNQIFPDGSRDYNGQWELYLNNDDGATFTKIPNSFLPALPANFFPYAYNEHMSEFVPAPSGIQAADFNGDGLDDILIGDVSGGTQIFTVYYSTGQNFQEDTDPAHKLHVDPTFDQFLLADVDGDGKLEGVKYSDFGNGSLLFKFFWFETGKCLQMDKVFDQSNSQIVFTSGYNGFSALDFDGDGIQELITSRSNKSIILRILLDSQIPPSLNCFTIIGNNHKIREIYSETIPSFTDQSIFYKQNFYGDFNGDGILDNIKVDNPVSAQAVKIRFGTGTSYTSPLQSISCPSGSCHFSDSRKFSIADINNDGKSDLIDMSYDDQLNRIVIRTNYGDGINFGPVTFNFLNNIGFPPAVDHNYCQTCTYPTGIAQVPEFLTGDFDGDGRMDIFFKTESAGVRAIVYFNKASTYHLASTISNGLRLETNFKYATLANGGSNLYVKGTGSTYPLLDFQGPMYVVKEFSIPDGIGGGNVSTYKYEGGTVHLQGKGFLGFDKVSVFNQNTNTKSVTEYGYLTSPSFIPEKLPVKAQAYILSPPSLAAQTIFTNSFTQFTTAVCPSTHAVAHFTKTTNTEYVDFLTAKKIKTDFLQYDGSGNVIHSMTTIGDVNNSVIQTTETFSPYTSAGTWSSTINNVVEKETTIVARAEDAPSTFTKETQYFYTTTNTLGNATSDVSKIIQNPNAADNKSVVTDLEYDPTTGVLAKQTISSPESDLSYTLPVKVTEFVQYDSKKRFVTELKNPLGQHSFAAYDPKWGRPLSETGVDGLTTKYQYDGYGRNISVTTPDHITSTSLLEWSSPASPSPLQVSDYSITGFGSDVVNNALYSVLEQRPGSPSSKIIYDMFGRIVAVETDGLSNKIFAGKKYDARGNIFKESATFENTPNALLPVITTNSYNNTFNQIIQTEIKAGSIANLVAFAYSYNNDGSTAITTTFLSDGNKQYTKITDASGFLKTAIDNGGTLNYKYASSGQLKETKLGNDVTNSMTYDDRGMQKTLFEVNSGTTEYNFSAYGELVSQKDANNNITTLEYNDLLGRLTIKKCTAAVTGLITNYNYNYVTSGNGLNQLQSVITTPLPNNNIYSYTYDNLSRVTKEDKTINVGTNLQQLTTLYSYDQFSNLQKETYPGGFAVKHTYNKNGYHTQINRGDNNDIIWRLDEMNAIGAYTKYTSHPQNNAVQTTKEYDNFGFLIRTLAPGVQDMNYFFEPASGNLKYRTDMVNPLNILTESFMYDQSDRLKTSTSQGLSVHYFPNGNIQDKSDVSPGTYGYHSTKLNAVENLPATAINISQATQNITYTSFNKAEKITEDVFDQRFAYGPFDERVTSELRINTNASERRYYSGSYEKTLDAQSGSTLSEINYISCGSGLVGMFVKDPANPNGQMYYPYTDHLGSILTVVNETGSEKYEQSFDAWGRKRNPLNWSYNNIPAVPAWLYRGYTGHEDMPQFALINMNGRMYDPVVGRMLSPDPYLQEPDNTQSHNRYSYAMNNPLKYTDPTGYNFISSGLDIIFSPFKLINAPVEFANDRINGVNRTGYLNPNYLFGNAAPYAINAGSIASPGSTAYSSWSGGVYGPGDFTSASGDEYRFQFEILGIESPAGSFSKNGKRYGTGKYYEAIIGAGWVRKRIQSERGLLMPVDLKYGITSPYTEGNRNIPELKQNRPHRAIDIGTPYGTPIISPWSGKIADANTASYGQYIIINHDYKHNSQNISTSYSHLSKMLVTTGMDVRRGDTIGYTGQYGTGPHLHFVLKIGKQKVNPAILFPYK